MTARPIEPTRFADGAAMLLAGVRRWHAFADAPRDIPAQWMEFHQLPGLPPRAGAVTYGVVCASEPQRARFEYFCAIEVPSFDGLPPEVGRMRVPAQRYAVFTHRGHVSGLQETWRSIWEEWLPRSGHQPANTPDFERYDNRYDSATASGEMEIWFPVVTGGQAPWTGGSPHA